MGRSTPVSCAVAAILALAGPCSAQEMSPSPLNPASRLRPESDVEATILAEGVCRSPSLRSMVAALQASDVIVYIVMRRISDRRSSGSLEFLGTTATDRILRVTITFPLDRTSRIAMLGHELQHAIEIARAPEVRDRVAFEDYYRSHGREGATETSHETEDARRTELRVRTEISARASSCK
jgi:hypothetical protein